VLVVIDNYDSFTYNLVQYLGEMGAALRVFRNDQVTLAGLQDLAPTHIVISPGPGRPEDGGVSSDVIRAFAGRAPILGVCLGHQCIGQVFGGRVVRAAQPVHGKTSLVYHQGQGVLAGLPQPFRATRYHSLIVDADLPAPLVATAHTAEGEVMAVQHRDLAVYGVQFHPESILTEGGKALLRNFLEK
jgi:anthranilate synthase/aminodeoxychorismate synthase-like glutamine amidotransferase